MKLTRRGFIKGLAAVAAVLGFPVKKPETQSIQNSDRFEGWTFGFREGYMSLIRVSEGIRYDCELDMWEIDLKVDSKTVAIYDEHGNCTLYVKEGERDDA